jgi:hypothetical protein
MRLVRPAFVLLPLAALAAGGCAANPSAGQQPGQVSCWNVSSAQSPGKTYCLTEEQWARFMAAANVKCKDGPPVKGLCPEYWKERERVQQRPHMSPYRESSLSGEGVMPQYVMPYQPMMPDGFVPMQPAGSQ